MKKFVLMMMSFLAVMAIIGCGGKTTTVAPTTGAPTTVAPTTVPPTTVAPTTAAPTTAAPTTVATDTDPVISGADDVTIEKNSVFVPLAGVTAFDQEDGDITSRITYAGNVNPMAVGVYTAVYTVVDDDGNVVSVERTVTVVFTDTQGPLLVGVGNITIYVGEDFDPLEGVSANDTVDGNVPVTYTGELNVWEVGTYTLSYSAIDNSDNETTKDRVVTVTFGDFVFGESTEYDQAALTLADEVYTTPAFSGGVINDSIADFTYVRVEIDMSAATTGLINVALGTLPGSATEIAVAAAQTTYTLYYLTDAPLVDQVFSLDSNGISVSNMTISISFAEVRDMVAPVLSVPSDEMAFVLNYSPIELEALLRTRVTAVDDIDGNLTSQVQIDYGSLDLATVGTYEVVYSVTDGGGNTSTFNRTVIIGNIVDSGFITDPTFQNNGNGQWIEKSNNGSASIAYDAVEGTMNITVTNQGDWLSAAGTYLKQPTSGLEVGQWYMMTFTVKTTIDRYMGFRMGLDTDQTNGWIDDFDGRSDIVVNLTGEYQTFNYFFKLDSLTSSAGYTDFKIELNLGSINYDGSKEGGVTTFTDVYMYKVVTSFEAPTYELNQGANLPVKFTVGDTAPNWADYVTFMDMSKNILTPTIDATAVDMNAVGVYDIIFTATDSHDMTTDYTLTIEVVSVENADTVGPVVTIKDGVPTTLDQFTNLGEIQLHQLVEAVDAEDGIITVLPEMVDDGGLNFNVAGVYTVTFTVYDLSGNITVFEVDVTIVDKLGPNINANDVTINVGDAYDPLALVTVTDNVDGVIDNANVTVTGLEAFMEGGVAVNEGIFVITLEVADALGNISTKDINVEVLNIEWDETTRTDLLGAQDEGPTHSTVTYNAVDDVYEITAIDTEVDPWDHARLVYYFSDLEMGKTYKFEIMVKADVATDLYFRVGATLSVDPWIDNFTGGLRTISIGTEYVTYQVVFTVDKAMPDGTAKFQFMYGYLPTDATNTIYVKTFDIVQMLEEVPAVYEDVEDLLGTQDEGPTHSTVTYNAVDDVYEITAIDIEVDPWDHARWVYYFTGLEMDAQYRFLITVKADVATDLYFRVGSTLSVDPWIDDFTGGLKTVSITTEYVTYEVVFTVDKAMPDGTAKFQFMYGYLSTDATNTIYVSEFKLQKEVLPVEIVYEDVEDLLGTQDEGPTHSTVTYNEVDDVYEITAIDTEVDPWDHARWVYYFTGLEMDAQYRFLITVKADVATDLYFRVGATLSVDPWIDNFTGGLKTVSITTEYVTYEVVFTVDKAMPDGTAKFQFMYGYLPTDATNTIYVSEFKLQKEVVPVVPSDEPIVFNDFEGYVDNTAYQADTTDNIVGTRIGGSTFVKTNGELVVDGENNYLIQNIAYASNGTNGIRIRISQADIPEGYQYLAVYIQATIPAGITEFKAYVYTAGGAFTDKTSTVIGDLSKIGIGTFIYIPLTSIQGDTAEMSVLINSSGAISGQLIFDSILFTKDFIVIPEPENEAPVITISDANLAAISGMTLEAGNSIETLLPSLLAMVNVNDAEDGVIETTQAMFNFGTLNPTNPVMGTYEIKINASDSLGLAATEKTFTINIVEVFEDFESYTDDADFKANWPRIESFRVSGGSWGLTAATLVTDAENNALEFTYGPGTNGIKFDVTKAELVALGAEYIGIYVKTSAELVGTSNIFQAFHYVGGTFVQVTTYGTISYTDEGTYFYIKVSDLPEGLTHISLMINLASGNTGTMTMDNIVIK